MGSNLELVVRSQMCWEMRVRMRLARKPNELLVVRIILVTMTDRVEQEARSVLVPVSRWLFDKNYCL